MEIWHYWVMAGLILIIAEIFTAGFVLASFGIGCLVAGLFAFFGFGFYVQLFGFMIATLIVFFTIRPLFNGNPWLCQKYFISRVEQIATNADALAGMSAMVIETINNDQSIGRVKIGGEDWRAVSKNDIIIEKGNRVKVIKVDGAKVIVSQRDVRMDSFGGFPENI